VTTYYLNGSATDWASTTSWRDGVVPVSGPTNVIVVAESGPPVTAGLDQAGVSINKLVIASGVRKKIGGNGESLKIDIDAGVDPRVIHHGAGGVDHALYIDGTLPRVELAGGALLSVTGGNVGGVLGLVGDGCRMEVSSSAIYGGEAGDTGVLRLTGSGNATIASHASDRLGVVSIEGHARLSTRRSIAGGTITGGGSISLLGDATISNAGVDATLTMHGARSRLFVRTDAGITIDLLYGWGGSIDMDGMEIGRAHV